MNIGQIIASKKDAVSKKIKKHKLLTPYISLRMLCYADYFFEATTKDELIQIIELCRINHIPYFLLGGGSNVVPLRDLSDMLVVKNSYQERVVLSESANSVKIKVSSGYSVSQLIGECLEKGWEGIEYHKGLPGTIGGAIYMNSKWTKPWVYMGDRLKEASILDHNGVIKTVKQKYFKFAYDYSFLQKTKEIVLDAVFEFTKNNPSILRERAFEALQYRKKTQPFGVATCGCFFQNISETEKQKKNLPTTSAGFLIDQCGLKGYTEGDFTVSQVHANFIVHTGKKGNPTDLFVLIKTIKKKVKKKFGIDLKEEVVLIR